MAKRIIISAVLLAAVLTAGAQQTSTEQWISPAHPLAMGKAPGVKVQLLADNGQEKTYAVIFSKGDEILGGLTEFAQKYNVGSARFTAIGGVDRAKIGTFHVERKEYLVHPVDGMSEVVSLIGDIALYNNKPVIHGHILVAMSDGTLCGGHLLQGYVYPTLEVMVTVEFNAMHRRPMPELNITVIDPYAKE